MLWPVNVKKYKLDGDLVRDQNGLDAVDSVTGFFAERSHCYWSMLADGNKVREDVAASQLDSTRSMYVFDSSRHHRFDVQ